MQNAELEAEISKSFEDTASYSVYADWLSERGDPRGELITVQLRLEQDPQNAALIARATALHVEHDAAWLGALAAQPKNVAITWRRGFVHAITLGPEEFSELEVEEMAELYGVVRGLPAAALLRDLVFGAVDDQDGQPSWSACVDALA